MQEKQSLDELVGGLKRIGFTKEDHARWLLNFAQQDLSELTAGGWLDLQWEMTGLLLRHDLEFIEVADGEFAASEAKSLPEPFPQPFSRESLLGWQKVLTKIMTQASTQQGCGRDFKSRAFLRIHDGRLSVEMGYLTHDDKLLSTFLFALEESEGRFRACAECEKFFIQRKGQAYCSPACSQTVRTRKYREKHREEVNKNRRKAYEKKQRKVNPNLKVAGRRAR